MERSDSYYFTVRMINGNVHEDDLKQLNELKHSVKIFNKYNKQNRRYVKLQGRLGKDNPAAEKYRVNRRFSFHSPYQCIKLADAQTADVYVYESYR